MNTNTNNLTVICKYEYKYLSNTKPKRNMLFYLKAIKVTQNKTYYAICGIWLTLCGLFY